MLHAKWEAQVSNFGSGFTCAIGDTVTEGAIQPFHRPLGIHLTLAKIQVVNLIRMAVVQHSCELYEYFSSCMTLTALGKSNHVS